MPMIDVYAPADLFPANADRRLAAELIGVRPPHARLVLAFFLARRGPHAKRGFGVNGGLPLTTRVRGAGK